MGNLKICLDDVRYNAKPKGDEARLISNRISKLAVEIGDKKHLEKCLTSIGSMGQTFCPATFTNGRRQTDNFEQIRMFVLDFDGTVNISEVFSRAHKYNLQVLFAYETLSSKDCNRFRISFLHETPITDIKEAHAIQNALMVIFPEADKNCKNIVQMYFGGKKLLYFNEFLRANKPMPMMNAESLFRNMALCLKDRHSANHYKKHINDFAARNGIKLNNNGLLDVLIEESFAEKNRNIYSSNIKHNNIECKNLPNTSMMYNIDNGRKLQDNSYNKSYRINFVDNSSIPTRRLCENQKKNYHRQYRSDILNDIRSRCRLFSEFETGCRRLAHDERFGLLTNLIQIESGAALFKGLLRHNRYYDDRPKKYEDWDYYVHYVRGYKPESCDGYCPYAGECTHGANMLTTAKVHRGKIEKLSNHIEVFVSIEEAEEDFRRLFKYAMGADRTLVYVLKAQVGLGKTQMLLEEIRDAVSMNPSMRVLIAVPTNKLKSELRKRAKAMGLKLVESPSIREYKDALPAKVWNRIEYLYKSGRSVMPYIKKVIDENDPESSAILEKHLRKLDAFHDCEGPAITTHKMLINMDLSKYDVVIIDEDVILGSIFPNKIDVKLPELQKFRKKLREKAAPGSAALKKVDLVIEHAEKCEKTGEMFSLPETDCDLDLGDIPMGVDILSLCSATDFVWCKSKGSESNGNNADSISFYVQDGFRDNIKGTKVIMMSATASKTMCGYYFGEENVEFHECKKARNLGTINQYHDRSYSRSDILKDTTILTKIKKWSGFPNTISHKQFIDMFNGAGDLNFGGTAGLDHLKGQNIDVIGVHHQPEWSYKLFAKSLDLVFDEDARMKTLTVEHNGYRFPFMTFEDEDLRNIQFYLLESEQEQAVGRARLLREPCTVNVFSSFPASQATFRKPEYDKIME